MLPTLHRALAFKSKDNHVCDKKARFGDLVQPRLQNLTSNLKRGSVLFLSSTADATFRFADDPKGPSSPSPQRSRPTRGVFLIGSAFRLDREGDLSVEDSLAQVKRVAFHGVLADVKADDQLVVGVHLSGSSCIFMSRGLAVLDGSNSGSLQKREASFLLRQVWPLACSH